MAEAEYRRFTVARDCQKKNTSENHSEYSLQCVTATHTPETPSLQAGTPGGRAGRAAHSPPVRHLCPRSRHSAVCACMSWLSGAALRLRVAVELALRTVWRCAAGIAACQQLCGEGVNRAWLGDANTVRAPHRTAPHRTAVLSSIERCGVPPHRCPPSQRVRCQPPIRMVPSGWLRGCVAGWCLQVERRLRAAATPRGRGVPSPAQLGQPSARSAAGTGE
jgi:hypothetical protein